MPHNYYLIRNGAYTRTDIRGINDHNERRKETYRNTDIDISRSSLNLHFKAPYNSYTQMLDKMVSDNVVSLRGLKGDATLFDEFILDVNSRYFEVHGGYDAAKQFYKTAYQFCCQEVGEENILSAVLHADERNKALSQELGHDVWHYHMHVVYLPTVKKEIKYSKRCKAPELRGTTKAVINQISHSKRWASAPLKDKDGKPILDNNGKPVLDMSYSQLQTRFAAYMQAHGYADIERGVGNKKAKHKSITEYKLNQDMKRAENANERALALEQRSKELSEEIASLTSALTNLTNIDEYLSEVNACRTLLQTIFDAILSYFSRTSPLRDRKQEHTLLDRIRDGFSNFFASLRNLIGFECVAGFSPEQCQSPQLAAEGEKLALSLQIASASQVAANQAQSPQNRKELEHARP